MKTKIIGTVPEVNEIKDNQGSKTRLSDDAFYLIAIGCQLKKLLGPASLQHFIATGETVVFNDKTFE